MTIGAEVRLSIPHPSHRRLLRSADRVVAGVSAGLAEHLAIDVMLVRLAFALLVAASGAGILLYAALWAVLPPPDVVLVGTRRGRTRALELTGIGLLSAAALVAVQVMTPRAGFGAWPFVVAGIGVALIWRQADEAQRARWAAMPGRLSRLRGRHVRPGRTPTPESVSL